ncbi:unnamed protein product [Polarella glacialis]|uniref:Thioredoxin domain-containing protein n=1 Tax=Polarella glacialis TaxID=89957 RepID=A0A813LWR7_POLGL|nr:unnamed protein product [Polarella glacialis]
MAGARCCLVLRLLAGFLLSTRVSSFDAFGFFGAAVEAKHAVDDLNESNFHPFMKDNPVTAVLFYAPWCFYSQQVMPVWDLAAQKLALHDPPVHLVKIDTSRHGSIGEEYGVRAFPTMKLFVDGAVFDFDSSQGRGWQQIVKWVNKHTERDHVLKNVQDLNHYLHDNDLNVIGLFPDGFNNSAFVTVSRHYDDVIFAEARGNVSAKEIAEDLGKHAALVCETINIGRSTQSSKQVELPRDGMRCFDEPRNPQRPEWTDRFKSTVEGKMLTVNRTDANEGWGQMIQMKCCDDESKAEKAHPMFPVPSVVMMMPHDERHAVYDGDVFDTHALDRWIQARRTPMVMRMDMDTAEKILAPGPENTPVLFMISRTADTVEESIVKEAAPQLRGRVHVCLSGMESQIEKRTADMAGVEADSGPVVTLVETHGGTGQTGQYHAARKYRIPSEGLTAAKVVEFITDYENGRLAPYLKSEPVPSAEDVRTGGPVGVLVGTTFTSASQDTTQDVLVDFYAPWCGHCRKFEPLYKQLAKKLKHVKTLRITKLDATRNEVEGMAIQGFPTIVLFPAGESPKHTVYYQGSRQPDDMNVWLHEHCTHKFQDTPPPKEAGAEGDPVESGLLDPDEEDL